MDIPTSLALCAISVVAMFWSLVEIFQALFTDGNVIPAGIAFVISAILSIYFYVKFVDATARR